MGNVVALRSSIVKPKQISGTRRNVSWSITYDTQNRRWGWCIIVKPDPQVYRGDSPTEFAAQQEVDALVRTLHN